MLFIGLIQHQKTNKRLSIKDIHRSQGGVVQCRHFVGRWFFKCERPHILVQRTSKCSKFKVCLHGQGGVGWARADIRRTRGGFNF